MATRTVISLFATLGVTAIVLLLVTVRPDRTLAQDKPKPGNTVEVRTNLLVTNDKGEYIDGVTGSDIKIFENGVEQQLTYFAVKKRPQYLSLVVDNTGSMRTSIDMVITSGKLIVYKLRPDDRANVIRFVSRDKISILQDWTSDRMRLTKVIDELMVEGGQSAITDALFTATEAIWAQKQQEGEKDFAIVLITDAEERASAHNETQLFDLLEGSDAQIFTIALIGDILPKEQKRVTQKDLIASENGQFALRLAAKTGGTAYIMKTDVSNNDIAVALTSLMTELRSQYVVGFSTLAGDKNGSPRKLTATVADGPNGEKRIAIIKPELILPKKHK